MNRFFVPRGTTAEDRLPIPTSIAHQVRRVLRLGDGDSLVLLEGDGRQVTCRLAGDECVVVSRDLATGEPRHRLTVCQALIKGDGLEEVVQHGTELGVAAFRLMVSDRCIVRDLSDRKLDRLRAIAREAAEQSERGVVPDVVPPAPLGELLGPRTVLLAERHDQVRLGALVPPARVIIGPEGGFAPRELDQALASGATLAGLGPRILRSETVALAAAAVILSHAGDFA